MNPATLRAVIDGARARRINGTTLHAILVLATEVDVTMSDLARAIRVSNASANLIANTLISRGFATRRSCAVDGRVTYLELTEKGKELIPCSP